MKIIDHIKAGAKVAPAFLIAIYCLFAVLDMVTTYLVTPDMELEGNWIVRYFDLNWSQNILIYSSTVFFVTFGVFIAWNYLHVYYQNNSLKYDYSFLREVFQNKKLLLCIIVLGIFYSHIINLGLIVINNILGYIYLNQIESFLGKISKQYISKQTYYLFLIQTVPILVGYVIATFKVKSIRNKYRALAVEEEIISG